MLSRPTSSNADHNLNGGLAGISPIQIPAGVLTCRITQAGLSQHYGRPNRFNLGLW
jgi:hypothetical protein